MHDRMNPHHGNQRPHKVSHMGHLQNKEPDETGYFTAEAQVLVYRQLTI